MLIKWSFVWENVKFYKFYKTKLYKSKSNCINQYKN